MVNKRRASIGVQSQSTSTSGATGPCFVRYVKRNLCNMAHLNKYAYVELCSITMLQDLNKLLIYLTTYSTHFYYLTMSISTSNYFHANNMSIGFSLMTHHLDTSTTGLQCHPYKITHIQCYYQTILF